MGNQAVHQPLLMVEITMFCRAMGDIQQVTLRGAVLWLQRFFGAPASMENGQKWFQKGPNWVPKVGNERSCNRPHGQPLE